ncbi:MAG: hypothetical protein IJF07_07040 [Lachnospiraceae bacterium]|nr:hypothetical protein [Lachnospiraceae bacterium]
MNLLRRFFDSVSAMAVVWFIMGSFCILFGKMVITSMPIVCYTGLGLQGVVLFIIIKNFLKLTRRQNNLLISGVKHSGKDEDAVRRLGELRTRVKANKVKVLLITIFQVLILVYAVGLWALMVAKKTGVIDTTAIILMVMAVLLGLLPLRHLGDSIEYYANGFIYCGDIYLYEKVGGIFFKSEHGPNTLTGILMSVNGEMLDGSYLKEPGRKYYETYFKRAIDPLQGK